LAVAGCDKQSEGAAIGPQHWPEAFWRSCPGTLSGRGKTLSFKILALFAFNLCNTVPSVRSKLRTLSQNLWTILLLKGQSHEKVGEMSV
jgi:hypothetical protein